MTSVYARRAVRGAAAIALALMGWRSAAAQEAAAFPYGAPAARDTRAGSGCPAGYLCGQNWSADDWLYSDLGFSNSGLTGRVTSEQFPPPGEPSLTQAISLVTWYGTTVDGAFQICTKPLSFRIEFYNDDGTGKPDCAHPVATFSHLVPQVADAVGVVCFVPFAPCPPVTRFTVRLPTLVNMPSGHFSIVSESIDPNCFFLLATSTEGNGVTWRWYEQPTPCYFYGDGGPGAPTTVDMAYCFQPAVAGACCLDCTGTCTQSDDFTCGLLGGRFTAGVACAQLDPPCGAAVGACCYDTGSCLLMTCEACVVANRACCLPGGSCLSVTPIDCIQRGGTPEGPGSRCGDACVCAAPCYCLGDLDCDGTIGFGDINQFVLYLSNVSAWQVAYPTCDRKSGDINCDGTYPSFGDINPFVALLREYPVPHCPRICPEPGPAPRSQGPSWAGPNTTCADCCVVVAGAPNEGETQNCVTPDTYDGGCSATSPAFKMIAMLPATIYGQSGTFAASPYRDEDWCSYTAVAPSRFTMTVRAEFALNLFVIHAGSDNICLNWWQTDAGTSGDACTDVTLVTHCLPPGKYYFVVRPRDESGVPCSADYKLDITAANCEPYEITCSAPDHTELSPCNDDPNHVDENGGCSGDPNDPNRPVDPNAFEALTGLVPGTPYVFCGTTWANNGLRDIDYYKFTLTERASVAWDVDTEIPIEASMEFTQPATGMFGPPSCTGGGNSFWTNICLPGRITSPKTSEH